MSDEIVTRENLLAVREQRNATAVRQGLPAIGTRMVNQHGIEWLVDGHIYSADLTSLARDKGDVVHNHPDDLLPVILPQNASQRLTDFWGTTDRCTSRGLLITDTMPHLRPQHAHADGHAVDAWSAPDYIMFFLDAAHVHETIFAHEIAHVYIDLVEDCEDYRVMRDLSDTSRARQFQHIQSFVLDRKVNEVLRGRDFDMAIVEQHHRETVLSLARAVIAGYRPTYIREAATIAMLLASVLLEQEQGLHQKFVLSTVLCYDGTIEGSLRLLRSELPEVLALSDSFVASVQRHGYGNRQNIGCAIDECVLAAFEFTGDPLRLDEELEEVPPVELYENDKWPLFLRGWSIQAKVEAGKVMAKYRIGSEFISRTSYTPGGTPQISFQQPDGAWTPPAIIPHAPQALPHQMAAATAAMQPRSILPTPRTPRHKAPPAFPHRVDPRQPVTPRIPPVQPSPPLPHMAPPFNPHRRRDYMAGLGRWLSQARLQEQLGKLEHPYAYVENNPVALVDPSGLVGVTSTRTHLPESKGACFWRIYTTYASNKGKYHYGPKRACKTANLKCGSHVTCGPCGPYSVRPYEGGCNQEDVIAYADWIRGTSSAGGNVCGGVHGADKLAHCWGACMAASCYGAAGSFLIRRGWADENDPQDIKAEDRGLCCSMENRYRPWRLSTSTLAWGCMTCCTRRTYSMSMY